jgi:hypothetical protein
MSVTKRIERPVIVTTSYRGVFFGYARLPDLPCRQAGGQATDTSGETITLRNARMAIYWGTTKGLFELADTGPTEKSKISAPAKSIELRGVTAVIGVSGKAEKKWKTS